MKNPTVAVLIKQNRYYFLGALALAAVLYLNVVLEMATQWREDPNYSHGFLIPLVSGYFLYEKRNDIFRLTAEPSNWGLIVILFSLVLLTLGKTAIEYFSMRISLVFLIAGALWYLFGLQLLTATLLPVFFLAFMVPLPYIIYDTISFPLKLMVARFSVSALQHMGMPVWREGNVILLPNMTLEVADACSGLRSLISLLALGTAMAFLYDLSPVKRVFLIAMTVPVAMATNAFRVIVTGVLANRYGFSAATGFFHEFSGLAVFAAAMAIMLGILFFLKKERL